MGRGVGADSHSVFPMVNSIAHDRVAIALRNKANSLHDTSTANTLRIIAETLEELEK